LLHLKEPAATVQGISRLVRSGGVVSFQEFSMTRARSVPPTPLVTKTRAWIIGVYRAIGSDPDVGEQVASILGNAGLSVEGAAASYGSPARPSSAAASAAGSRYGGTASPFQAAPHPGPGASHSPSLIAVKSSWTRSSCTAGPGRPALPLRPFFVVTENRRQNRRSPTSCPAWCSSSASSR
jgi:hypothetical protein